MPSPPPSDWGKLSAGQTFGLLATDFGRALFSVPWGRYELLLIGYLIENCWGVVKSKKGKGHWPDPVACRPNFYALSIQWRVPCQRLYEARDSLAAKGFAVVDEDGIWINKNADQWVDPKTGGPLVADALLDYAADARTRNHPTHEHADFTPQREPISETISRPGVKSFHAPACNDFTPQRETVSRPSVKPPIEERAQDLIQTQTPEDNPPTPQGGNGGGGASSMTKPLRSQRKATATPEQIASLRDWAKAVLGDRCELESFDTKIGGYCVSYPLDWIEGAILLGKANAPANQLDRYVNGCLMRWYAAGKPSYEEANAIKAARSSAGPPARERPVHVAATGSPMWKLHEKERRLTAERNKGTNDVP